MNIVITTLDGKTPGQGAADVLSYIERQLATGSGKAIASSFVKTVRAHFQSIYPGSTHYSPANVNEGRNSGNEGEAIIDVPGITRAYKDLHIKPINSRYLTIPLHADAYGKRASQVGDLVFLKNKDGKAFLAKKTAINGGLTLMYALAREVYQPRNPGLMPSNEYLLKHASDDIMIKLEKDHAEEQAFLGV